MPRAYKLAIIALGGILVLSGAGAIVIATFAPVSAAELVRSYAGGFVAALSGAALVRAAYARRGPRWLLDLLQQGEDAE
jgi:hypothetical protein